MKKIISIILIPILTIIPFLPVLNVDAEESEAITLSTFEGTNIISNTSTITVTELPSNFERFQAFKIVDVFYNEITNEVVYEFTDEFKSFLAQSESHKELSTQQYLNMYGSSITSGSAEGNSYPLDILSSEFAVYIRDSKITGRDMTTTNYSATLETEAGSYLILPTNNKYVYSVMVGNVQIYGEDNEWKIKDATIVAKYDDLVLESYLSSYFFKDMQDLNQNADKLYIEKSFNIDNYFAFCFNFDVDHPRTASNKFHKIEILIPEGIEQPKITDINLFEGFGKILTIDSDGIVYLHENINGQDTYEEGGKVTIEDNKIIFEYTFFNGVDNIYGLILIKLNENATLGPIGNKIITQAYYANDPYDSNSIAVIESVNTAYTYGVKIYNYAAEPERTPLSNSVFEVYKDTNLENKVGEIVTTDGIGTLNGVEEGTYYLIQKKAASGYKKIGDVISLEINTGSEYTEIEFINEKMWFLPSTGGAGTIIYTVIGLGIIIASSIGIIYYRKKKQNNTKK